MEDRLEDAVARWRSAGLLEERTVRAIRGFEQSRTGEESLQDTVSRPDSRMGVLAEGLAYLGAALAFGAGFTLFSELWVELGGLVRTVTAAAGTLAVGGGAAALRRGGTPAVSRLRSLLAALTVAGVAVTLGVGLTELTSISEEATTMLAGSGALTVVVPIHLRRPSWPTALTAKAALLTTVLAGEAAAGWADHEVLPGLTLAVIGLTWAGLGWTRVLRPQSAFEIPGLLVFGVGAQVLAFDAAPSAALVVAITLACAVLAAGTIEARTSLAVIGGLGITVFAPQLVFELFGETIGGPLGLLVGSLTLVVAAVLVLRRRGTR